MQRRHFIIQATVGLAISTLSLMGHAAAEIDQTAPGFTATSANGKPISLSDFKGKTVVLEWTNHDCPFVKKHYDSGNIQKLQKEATAK